MKLDRLNQLVDFKIIREGYLCLMDSVLCCRKGKRQQPGHKGLFVYSLSWFVLSVALRWLNQIHFSIRNSFWERNETGVATLYLVLLYNCLDECLRNIVQCADRYDVVTHTDISFLQLFVGKFRAIDGSHMNFWLWKWQRVVRGVTIERADNLYKQRDWWQANVKQANNKVLSKIIDVEKTSNFILNLYTSQSLNNSGF